MANIDIVLLVILGLFMWGGFWTGLIQSVGGVIGLFVGAILASRLADPFGNVLEPVFGGQAVVADIAAFAILFLLAGRVVGLAFIVVNRAFNLFAIVPGMKLLNRLLGTFFGLLEGALYLGIIIEFAARLPLDPGWTDALEQSSLVPLLTSAAAWMTSLFPAALRETEKVIDQVA